MGRQNPRGLHRPGLHRTRAFRSNPGPDRRALQGPGRRRPGRPTGHRPLRPRSPHPGHRSHATRCPVPGSGHQPAGQRGGARGDNSDVARRRTAPRVMDRQGQCPHAGTAAGQQRLPLGVRLLPPPPNPSRHLGVNDPAVDRWGVGLHWRPTYLGSDPRRPVGNHSATAERWPHPDSERLLVQPPLAGWGAAAPAGRPGPPAGLRGAVPGTGPRALRVHMGRAAKHGPQRRAGLRSSRRRDLCRRRTQWNWAEPGHRLRKAGRRDDV